MHNLLKIFSLLLLTISVSYASVYSVRFEAEQPLKTDFPTENHPSFKPASEKESSMLSGGKWIGSTKNDNGSFLEYEITLEKDAQYYFYARKISGHGSFSWSFDSGEKHEYNKGDNNVDSVRLRMFLGVSWVFLGKISLDEGKHILRIEKTDTDSICALDCFTLSDSFLIPNGKMEGFEVYTRADEGYFAFNPKQDSFLDTALLDLRRENGDNKGEDMEKLIQNGEDIIGEKSKKRYRLWGVTVGNNVVCMNKEFVDYYVKMVAKRGINLIRYMGPIYDSESEILKADKQIIDNFHYFASAAKREGVYIFFDFYLPWKDDFVTDGWGIEGLKGKQSIHQLLFAHPKVLQMYEDILRDTFLSQNPYTGIPLGKDSVLALYEIVNEDAYFFWTFNPQKMPSSLREILEKDFGDFVLKKYPSFEKAFDDWGSAKYPKSGDLISEGRLGLYNAGELSQASWSKASVNTKRAYLQTEFMAESLRSFYESISSFMRESLGYKSPIIPTRWKGADYSLALLNYYSCLGAGSVSHIESFPTIHEGRRAFFAVDEDSVYRSVSVLTNYEKIPFKALNFTNALSFNSSLQANNPNRFRAEQPFISAVYSSLQGVDGVSFFTTGELFWQLQTDGKWSALTPVSFGQYPALSLMYRRGYVSEKTSAVMKLSKEKRFSRDDIFSVDSYLPLMGKIESEFVDNNTEYIKPLVDDTLYDAEKGIIQSVGEEILLDYKNGILRVNAKKAQGASGFLNKSEIVLDDITIKSGNEYLSVMVVSMDGEDLNKSKKMLMQVVSEEKAYGYKEEKNLYSSKKGEEKTEAMLIKDMGMPPVTVKNIDCTVSFTSGKEISVSALDENGYFREGVESREGSIKLLNDAIYYMVKR